MKVVECELYFEYVAMRGFQIFTSHFEENYIHILNFEAFASNYCKKKTKVFLRTFVKTLLVVFPHEEVFSQTLKSQSWIQFGKRDF